MLPHAVALAVLATLGLTRAAPTPAVVYPAAGDVDTTYPYTGPAVPIADWVDQTINGNGKGFVRLTAPPAVVPGYANPTNNINTISLSYIPGGMNVHFSTPFGIGGEPCVNWGTDVNSLTNTKGYTTSYNRTPDCGLISDPTQCNQFFHEVQITGLQPNTVYYYQIPGGNGTTPSNIYTFKTAAAAGDKGAFTVAVLNDMGKTNAQGTHDQLIRAVGEGVAFAWHGGDISYADDWYSGILPCQSDWDVCVNGTYTELPGPNPDGSGGYVPSEYLKPLPAGEVPNQGGPNGGDFSVLYETNWDLWQQWMSPITTNLPYMVNPGNHEAACAEFDGPHNELTAYLNDDKVNGTAAKSDLTYYSCPESQRNYTAYRHRFNMNGEMNNGGKGNFWYSFDYGLAHFISMDGETDFYQSPESPFVSEVTGSETHPNETETYITNAGPFGYINGSWKDNKAYEQYQWLKNDLASVDRTKTPWVFAMSHRPFYSSEVSAYQTHIRNAFEDLFLEYGLDAYFAGHIHWYERLFPLGKNGTIDTASVSADNHTYTVNHGKSVTYITNGQAGNIESHSELGKKPVLNITAHLDTKNYGFSKLNVMNETHAQWQFIYGSDGSVGDYVNIVKPSS